MKNDTIKPFADDAGVLSIGSLSIENGTDAIAIHGDAEIARDRVGLENARLLASFFADAVKSLEAQGDLPERAVVAQDAGGEVDNPFA